MPKSLTKFTDSKGRVTLGKRFANRTVIVRSMSPTEVSIALAAVVPKRELWLQKNRTAMASIQRGLRQARAGKFIKNPPDLTADRKLVKRLRNA